MIQIYLNEAEEAEYRKKLRYLAKNHETSISEFVRNLIDQAYNSECPNKGTDYREFIERKKRGEDK